MDWVGLLLILLFSVSRNKKLPQYGGGLEEDTFMYSGIEDLVPYLEEDNGNWAAKEYPNNGNDGYTVKRYRPRIEFGFAIIERITYVSQDVSINSKGTYWKVTTGDNMTTIFGKSDL
ncbi:SpvB/TcaC N-terminal domain-containing protein [uncultured Eudoraea sp.]|uniref:SpvB/TcaC N-terminal domain-containing protein n=1 Tax=uncultured Eudoraea sp. TaxID=1035614 RepID=UPI002609AA6B|nr:SpvB/TcaC N-terminal domain-containing protein [uncultured Eudoraea sp.]